MKKYQKILKRLKKFERKKGKRKIESDSNSSKSTNPPIQKKITWLEACPTESGTLKEAFSLGQISGTTIERIVRDRRKNSQKKVSSAKDKIQCERNRRN